MISTAAFSLDTDEHRSDQARSPVVHQGLVKTPEAPLEASAFMGLGWVRGFALLSSSKVVLIRQVGGHSCNWGVFPFAFLSCPFLLPHPHPHLRPRALRALRFALLVTLY